MSCIGLQLQVINLTDFFLFFYLWLCFAGPFRCPRIAWILKWSCDLTWLWKLCYTLKLGSADLFLLQVIRRRQTYVPMLLCLWCITQRIGSVLPGVKRLVLRRMLLVPIATGSETTVVVLAKQELLNAAVLISLLEEATTMATVPSQQDILPLRYCTF